MIYIYIYDIFSGIFLLARVLFFDGNLYEFSAIDNILCDNILISKHFFMLRCHNVSLYVFSSIFHTDGTVIRQFVSHKLVNYRRGVLHGFMKVEKKKIYIYIYT